jgi:hypothetical protein
MKGSLHLHCISLYFAILDFGSIVASGLETKVPYRDCGSPLAFLTRLEVIPCEKDVCILTRGENVTLIVDFVTRVRSEILAINVYQQDRLLSLDSILWHVSPGGAI